MLGDKSIYEKLKELDITFEYFEHPPVNTIAEMLQHWKNPEAMHCKNLFFRNNKGKKHYLVVFKYSHTLNIKDLEQRLGQGKLSFASEKRLSRYLNTTPGSVSPLGLVNDTENHVKVFLDKNLRQTNLISFHPNNNRASLSLLFSDFERYLEATGNAFEFTELYS